MFYLLIYLISNLLSLLTWAGVYPLSPTHVFEWPSSMQPVCKTQPHVSLITSLSTWAQSFRWWKCSEGLTWTYKSCLCLWTRRPQNEQSSGFWWQDLREKDHLEDPSVGRKIILKWIFRKWDEAWTRLIWVRTRICALWLFHKMWRICWLAKDLLTS